VDITFHSCEHCDEYSKHCKKLARKLKASNTSWSCGDYTKCESWRRKDVCYHEGR
jgi:hypothetical protein